MFGETAWRFATILWELRSRCHRFSLPLMETMKVIVVTFHGVRLTIIQELMLSRAIYYSRDATMISLSAYEGRKKYRILIVIIDENRE